MTQNIEGGGEHSRPAGSTTPPAPAPMAMERRRRFLTAGLATGSALLVGRPIATLASTRYCSYSGMQSGVTSLTKTPTCPGGKSPGYYKKPSNWPPQPLQLSNGVTVTPDSKFSDVFNAGPSDTLIDILNNETNTDEFHWIAALLNAFAFGTEFPYTPDQVVKFYTDPGAIDPTASPPPTAHQVVRFFADNFENL